MDRVAKPLHLALSEGAMPGPRPSRRKVEVDRPLREVEEHSIAAVVAAALVGRVVDVDRLAGR